MTHRMGGEGQEGGNMKKEKNKNKSRGGERQTDVGGTKGIVGDGVEKDE